MRWIESLELRLGRFAVPHLTRYLVAFTALVWVLEQMAPGFASQLTMDADGVRRGEVWRLVTFLFLPHAGGGLLGWVPNSGPLWLAFYLMFLWMLGDGLEQAWGPFKVNLYFLIGAVGTAVVGFFLVPDASGALLNLSLTFAFATLYPDFSILLFFFVPVRIKWIALVLAAILVLQFLLSEWGGRLSLLVVFANYFLFFGPHWWRLWSDRRYVLARRRAFEEARGKPLEAAAGRLGAGGAAPVGDALHSCHTCGRTDATDPELEFRVSSVDGEEYCREHLPRRTT